MKHYGDITKISGKEIPIVDVITFGAPCQDLSVAGKRKGMLSESRGDDETTRSGLFFEAIRIIKEMRERDVRENGRSGYFIRPRYAIYENVPGAFSSNNGDDFKTVIEEIVRIVEDDIPDLRTVVQGAWSKSGCVYDSLGKWSIAWRLHDAQFWGATKYVDGRVLIAGTPQRRKRISLVADFGGLTAPEVLFERKGLHWHPDKSETAWERTSERTEGSIGAASKCINGQDIKSKHSNTGIDIAEPLLLESNQNHATVQKNGISTTLPASMGEGGGYVPMVVEDQTVYRLYSNCS